MLRSLSYSVVFPVTGQSLAGEFDFARGMTAISGSNEAGKTMILEMIRYCLWGTRALRGTAADYKRLTAALSFTVKGIDYRVARTNGSAVLSQASEVIVAGTKPVNAKIIDIFGYDMTVFDVANNIAQGQVEALGAMTAGDRKKMVDQTIGLNVLDELHNWLHVQATDGRKTYEALSENLVEPVAPPVPEGYRPSSELAALQGQLTADVAEFHQITGWLEARAGTAEPAAVNERDIPESLETLRAAQTAHNGYVAKISAITAQLARLKTCKFTLAQVEAFQAEVTGYQGYLAASLVLARYPRPTYTRAQLQDMLTVHQRQALEAKIETLKNKGSHTCPACEHTWDIEKEEIDAVWAEKALLPKAKTPVLLTKRQIKELLDQHTDYDAHAAEILAAHAVPKVTKPAFTQADIDRFVRELGDEGARISLQAELTTLESVLSVTPNRAADIEEKLRVQQAQAEFRRQYDIWAAWVAAKTEKEARLVQLDGCVDRLAINAAALMQAKTYERMTEFHARATATYIAAKAKADDQLVIADRYEAAKKGIKALKVSIKGHLVPSLNKVASGLIAQMTASQRKNVAIDEDFDILVDGQPLNTLSGSGKAVANLAIRVGLGQVLTNKVFSVLMGDEVDASMDDDRAGYTAECLERLTKSIGQVVLVSHKQTDAEHHIQVG